LKILYLIYDDINNPWCGGGGGIRCMELAKNIPVDDSITVVTGNYPSAKNHQERNLKIIRCGSDKGNLISRLTFVFSAKRYINTENPDIIIVSFSELTPILFFKKTGKPRVAIMHHILGEHSFKKFKMLGFIPHLTQYLGVRSYDNIIVVSREMEEKLRNRFPRKRVIFIPNGIDKKLFMSKPESGKNILFLGRLDIYMKGLDILLAAFAKLSNDVQGIRLQIAGRGSTVSVQKIEKMISSFKLQKSVQLLLNIDEQTKIELLSRCLFFCMPSRYEGWGIAAVEAAACSKAIIAADIPGLREAVKNNYNAILVNPDSAEELHAAMKTLVIDEGRRMKYENNSRKWADQFNWEKTSSDELSFYTEVLSYKYDSSYFNGHAKNYMSEPSLFWKNRIKNILELISPGDGDSILDLGTGIGSVCIEASGYGARCIGVDFAEDSIKTAEDLFKKFGKGSAKFIKGDVSDLSFLDQKFNKIICADLIEHLSENVFEKMLSGCRRLLNTEGRLFIYSPYPTHLIEKAKSKNLLIKKDESHIGLNNMLNIGKVLENNNFEVERIYFLPTHIPVLNSIEKNLMILPGFGNLFKRRICITAKPK